MRELQLRLRVSQACSKEPGISGVWYVSVVRAVCVVGLALTGCTFEGAPGLGVDAAPDGPPDTPECLSYSTLFDTCTETPSNATDVLILTGASSYDTTTHVLSTGGVTSMPPFARLATTAGEIDVVFIASLTIAASANFRVQGPNPLVIASRGTIEIRGVVNVANAGAGNRSDCGTSTGANGLPNAGGSGGGGGGGFQGEGGFGGSGDKEGTPTPNANGGALAVMPAGLLGGCSGGLGGSTSVDSAGKGGGAIGFASASDIVVETTGVIHAGGGPGLGGGCAACGGGGGGSGGMILLEARAVTVSGILAANGGSGGEGGTGRNGEAGKPSLSAAVGGQGGDVNGGGGGHGSITTTLEGGDSTDRLNGGGGGGGGAAGFIAIGARELALPTTILSPEFTPWAFAPALQ